jgi:hypothetical protein
MSSQKYIQQIKQVLSSKWDLISSSTGSCGHVFTSIILFFKNKEDDKRELVLQVMSMHDYKNFPFILEIKTSKERWHRYLDDNTEELLSSFL